MLAWSEGRPERFPCRRDVASSVKASSVSAWGSGGVYVKPRTPTKLQRAGAPPHHRVVVDVRFDARTAPTL